MSRSAEPRPAPMTGLASHVSNPIRHQMSLVLSCESTLFSASSSCRLAVLHAARMRDPIVESSLSEGRIRRMMSAKPVAIVHGRFAPGRSAVRIMRARVPATVPRMMLRAAVRRIQMAGTSAVDMRSMARLPSSAGRMSSVPIARVNQSPVLPGWLSSQMFGMRNDFSFHSEPVHSEQITCQLEPRCLLCWCDLMGLPRVPSKRQGRSGT